MNANVVSNEGLVVAEPSSFILRSGSKTVLASDGPGRNSIKLRSNHQYTAYVYGVSSFATWHFVQFSIVLLEV